MTSPIPESTKADMVRWLLRKRMRLRIRGASMAPTLNEGDVVFVDTSAYANATPRDGDIVVANHPQEIGLQIIKRIEFIDDGGAYLKSDNTTDPGASDSRRFGLVPLENIIGKVTATARAEL